MVAGQAGNHKIWEVPAGGLNKIWEAPAGSLIRNSCVAYFLKLKFLVILNPK